MNKILTKDEWFACFHAKKWSSLVGHDELLRARIRILEKENRNLCREIQNRANLCEHGISQDSSCCDCKRVVCRTVYDHP